MSLGEVNTRTQFPIEDTPQGFERRINPIKCRSGTRSNWLSGVSPDHIAAIEALQPYKRVRWTKILRELSNEDKHRTIPLLGYYMPVRTINVGGTEQEAKSLGGYRKPGDMNVYYPATFVVHFASVESADMTETLEVLESEVRSVIDAFEADLQSTA
jgi:hypothetical protein